MELFKDQNNKLDLEFTSPKTEDEVFQILEKALGTEFQLVKMKPKKKKTDTRDLYCRVKTKMLSPTVSVAGPISLMVKDARAKVMIDGETRANRWFLFLFVISVFFPPLFLILGVLFMSQKKASKHAFERVTERLDFDTAQFE
ncbi:hypothetical protein LPB19_11620 [Marinobacter salinisoli]|uniref:Uncharacterized protein n=1 Tax=Marinobacter salinisoli TaxID=2769486 RepID=A0ABX7MNZ1_9GAMM|nr:hypothetical protein [Marinobacter salinisoli]QSP93844.1 hypothetical protein LPB19_11620 [Marinobacter salinisoli]